MKILLKYKSILFALLLMCLLTSCGTSDADIKTAIQSGEQIKQSINKYYIDHKKYPKELIDLYPKYLNDGSIHNSRPSYYYKGWYYENIRGVRYYMYYALTRKSGVRYDSKLQKDFILGSCENNLTGDFEVEITNDNKVKLTRIHWNTQPPNQKYKPGKVYYGIKEASTN